MILAAAGDLLNLSSMPAEAWQGRPLLRQVFPPRTGPPPSPQQAPVPQPRPPAAMPQVPPQFSAPPAPVMKTIPFTTLLGGDLSKAFIQITNLRSPLDSNFVIGQSLAGRFTVPPHVHDAANSAKVYLHVNGLSNPPIVKSEGNELHLEFHFPALQFKTYYKEYSTEGDQAVGDTTGDSAVIDLYLIPITNHQGFPTYQSARAVFRGALKPQDKCVFWFDMIFPLNVCDVTKDYLKNLGPAIENGMREAMLHPQTRSQFDQVVWQGLRANLLMQAGVNPMSPAQIQVVESSFSGTNYIVKYFPR